VSDGAGRWRACRFGVTIEPAGEIHAVALAPPALTVGFALVKGGRPELVVQKLTELGIDHIVPFAADRSVVAWDEGRATKHGERLRKVAREASMQSRRCHLPAVGALVGFDDLLRGPGVALADRAGEPPTRATTTVLVGPEGGWSPDERDRARLAGAGSVRVATQVLRAETAAIAVGTVVAALRAGFVAEVS
jgi:16S rRNA (uracil1498-N3)-methyltransferase